MKPQVGTIEGSDETYDAAAKPRRGTRGLMVLLLVLGSVAAGVGVGASGLLASAYEWTSAHPAAGSPAAPVFVALPEFNVAIGGLSGNHGAAVEFGRHLRAVVQLETDAALRPQVEALQPRIVDAVLTFLHALDERDLASLRSLDRLKAQMLHRIRQVTGDEAVRGVLVTELTVL
jgi:flagellar basal body-associated protein FliL